MKDKTITFEEAKKLNTVNLKGLAKDFSKQSFWHYTKAQNLPKIFSTEEKGYTLLCNSLTHMNDLTERSRANAQNVFVSCFCNTESEKIPMWYLYGSLTGNGAAIGFTPSKMLEFLNSINYVYGTRTIDNTTISEKIPINTLEIKYGWIYYAKYEQDKTKFYYKQKFYEITDFDKDCNNFYFLKEYAWNYEKEFRIVIIDKENRNFNNILLPIPPNLAKQLKLKVGTTFSYQSYKLPMEESKIQRSTLKIEMDLLERFEDEVLNHLKKKPKEILKQILKQIISLTSMYNLLYEIEK